MAIFLTIASIFTVTAIVWSTEKVLSIRICPVCAGVSAAWIGLLALKFSGYPIDNTLPAMLMGGSIVGIVYQLEKKFPAGKFELLFKTLFIPAGFITVYSLLNSSWAIFFAVLASLAVILLGFGKIKWLYKNKSDQAADAGVKKDASSANRKRLEREIENCC